MSLLSPALPPLSGGIVVGDAEPPAFPPAPSPENDDVSPPPIPNVQIPPLLSPPQSSISVAIPSPLASPPLAPPPASPPNEPPLISQPNPVQKKPIPALKKPQPRSVPDKPVNIPPPTPTPRPSIVKANPATPALPSPPLKQPPLRPPHRHSRTRPEPEPSPSKPNLTRPKHIIPTYTPPPGTSSTLPTSAILPSPPPVALPVPQTPDGGAWVPFMSETPAPLPSLPKQPGVVVNSPAAPMFGNSSVGSSQLVPPGGDHQNIEASTGSAGKSSAGSSTFLPGLCIGGVLLLLLGVVFTILVVCCKRRREKRFDDYGSGKKYGTAFSGFEDNTSLPQYSKQSSNPPGNQVMINATSAQKPPTTSDGSNHGGEHTTASPTLAISYSSGTFTYDELSRATDRFSEHNLLGQGGFGYVHKGILPNGKEVAVKQLKMGGHQGEREFQAEVETISQVHHKHLVSLVGYCIAGSERLLVYEFVPNNTMEFHLHGKGQPVMDWPTRLKIAIGAAKGLAYLHEDCSPTIIHRDIKASNILLNFNFEAKVSDFGLAKIFNGTNSSITHITTRVVGTFGYLAPEYASSGKVTDKSDVYSYGVMLLELITGRPPICNFESATNGSLVNWARPLLSQAIGDGNFDTLADPQLKKKYNISEMANMVACAAACVRLSAWRRPRMSQVVRTLEGNLSPSELDDGTRPGESSMQFPFESLDFDAHNYMENLKRMALASNSGYNPVGTRD